jgi:hypothetical protein
MTGMSLAVATGMKKETPQPDDSPDEAQAKSKSVEERVPTVIAPKDDEVGPGEEVLSQEAKAQRQQPRP